MIKHYILGLIILMNFENALSSEKNEDRYYLNNEKIYNITIENKNYNDECYQHVRKAHGNQHKQQDGLRIAIFGNRTFTGTDEGIQLLELPQIGESYSIKATFAQLTQAEFEIADENLKMRRMAHPLVTMGAQHNIPSHTTRLKITIEKGQGVENNGAGMCYPAGIMELID